MLVCSLAVPIPGLTGMDAPADSPEALAKRIQAQVIPASLQKLNALVAGPDSTIALAAAWERVRRTTPDQIAVQHRSHYKTDLDYFNAEPGPDKAVLARFIRLVEKRARLRIPPAWKASTESAKYTWERGIWFPTLHDGFSKSETVKRAMLESMRPRHDGDHWIVKARGVSLALPAGDPNAEFDWAHVELGGDTAYVALYEDWGFPYAVYAVNRRTNGIAWSSKVWASGDYAEGHGPGGFGASGQSQHIVEMELAGQRLGLYGISPFGIYVEVFDAKTGKNECRFSTSYFPRG